MGNTRKQHMVRMIGEGLPDCVVGLYDAVDYLGSSPNRIRRIISGEISVDDAQIIDAGWQTIRKGRECVRCGYKIKDTRCSVYCPNCRRENAKAGKIKREQRMPYITRRRNKPKSPLSQMAQEARDHGMSYGQYMTYLTARWFE